MAQFLYRVTEGPYTDGFGNTIPARQWGVVALTRLPDDDDPALPPDLGAVRFVCQTEQEAERKARECIFGQEKKPSPLDPLDALPDEDDEVLLSDEVLPAADAGDWPFDPLPPEDEDVDPIDPAADDHWEGDE
jgi:hypothetical protein